MLRSTTAPNAARAAERDSLMPNATPVFPKLPQQVAPAKLRPLVSTKNSTMNDGPSLI